MTYRRGARQALLAFFPSMITVALLATAFDEHGYRRWPWMLASIGLGGFSVRILLLRLVVRDRALTVHNNFRNIHVPLDEVLRFSRGDRSRAFASGPQIHCRGGTVIAIDAFAPGPIDGDDFADALIDELNGRLSVNG